MARPAPHGRSACAWWRGAVVVAALAGYVAAWGGTSAGQGWRLAPHLTLAHTQAPPPLVAETPHPVLTTLRGADAPAERAHAHAHGETHGHPLAHAHGTPHEHDADRHAAPGPSAPDAGHLLAARAEPPPAAGQSGAHRHGSVVHSHAPPPARDDAPAVSLDKHQLPAGACVPPPPSADAAPTGGPDGAPAHVGLPVETPPPLARG